MLLRESVIALDPGSVLAGRYQVRRVLGKGATGVVLEADDRVSRSLVALKVFKPEIATDDRWQEIVGSELRHARRLSHPNVCRVFDAGEADGYRFLSMEYAGGGSLRQRLKDAATATEKGAAPRTMEERVADARAVVEGLAAIHGAGIIHRDVKPDNVLRMEDGRLVVTDFGLAVAPGTTTFMSGYSGAVGTPSYMAPEVALGGDATTASDVFALGVILHEIFFNRRPEWETTKRGRFVKPPAIRKGSRIERSMCRLCLECLDPLAPKRPQDASEVKKKFERAVLGRYGTVKGAVKAGRWGIVAGLVLAVGGTGLAVLSTRAKGAVEASVVGQPADWSKQAQTLLRREGGIHCVYPSPDGRVVGMIWGQRREAGTLTVATGKIEPWPLLPETYAVDCPQFSPDGQTVLYATSTAQVMIGADALGSSPRRLASGFLPRWLPGGREFVHGFDMRRVASSDLNGLMSLLPEAGMAGDSLFQLAVDPKTGLVAALYHYGPQRTLAIIHYNVAEGKATRPTVLPVRGRAAHFAEPYRVSLVLREQPHDVIGTLTSATEMQRTATLGDGFIQQVVPVDANRFVIRGQLSYTLKLADEQEAGRVIASGEFFGRLSFARTGDAVFEQRLRRGKTVVGYYEAATQRLKLLTDRGEERDPILAPDGKSFVYMDRSAPALLKHCPLPSGACRSLSTREPVDALLGISPDASRLVIRVRTPLRMRIKLFSLRDSSVTDIAPIAHDCRVRWPEDRKFWLYTNDSGFQGWVEIDADTRVQTGRREAYPVAEGELCPPPPQSPLERRQHFASELVLVTGVR